MKKSVHGYVLLVVLIFICIISALSLFDLQYATQSLRSSFHLWQRSKDLLMAEQALKRVEISAQLDSSACTIPITSPMILAKQTMEWWSIFSCSDYLADNRYYYTIEALGLDGCAYIGNIDNNHPVKADYYRITLLIPTHHGDERIIVQSTIVKANQTLSACAGELHLVTTGRQMWREI